MITVIRRFQNYGANPWCLKIRNLYQVCVDIIPPLKFSPKNSSALVGLGFLHCSMGKKGVLDHVAKEWRSQKYRGGNQAEKWILTNLAVTNTVLLLFELYSLGVYSISLESSETERSTPSR